MKKEGTEEKQIIKRAAVQDLTPYIGDREYSRETFIKEAGYFLQMTVEGMVEAGRRLICLKEMEGHGRYLDALEEIGISRQRANELMAIARFVTEKILPKFPDSGHLKRLETMGKTRLLLLSRIPDDVVNQFDSEGDILGKPIDEVAAMPLEMLRDEIRSLRSQMINGKKQNRRLQEKIDSMEKAITIGQGKDRSVEAVTEWTQMIFSKLVNIMDLMKDGLSPKKEVFQGETGSACHAQLRKVDALLGRVQQRWENELKDKWGVD